MTDEHASSPPRERPTNAGLVIVMGAIAWIAFVLGLLLVVAAHHTQEFFAWPMTDAKSAALLGSAYLAGAVYIGLSVASARWAETRSGLVVTVVLLALTSYATSHTGAVFEDEIGPRRLISWGWVAVHLLAPPLLGLLLVVQLFVRGRMSRPRQAMPFPALVVIGVPSLVAAGAGAYYYGHPTKAVDVVPWPTSPFEARLLATWVVAFGLAGTLAALERDAVRARAFSAASVLMGVLLLGDVWLLHLHVTSDTDGGRYLALAGAGMVALGALGLALHFALPDREWWAARISERGGRRPGGESVERFTDYGFFGPDSVTWRVWSYPTSLTLGVQRALDDLEPLTVGSTAEVVDYLATIAFADADTVLQAVYPFEHDDHDPDTQLRVLLTTWQSVLRTYERIGPGPLSPDDERRYWAECATAAEVQSIDPATVPTSSAAIDHVLGGGRWRPEDLSAPVQRLTYGPLARLPQVAMRRLAPVSRGAVRMIGPVVFRVTPVDHKVIEPAQAFARQQERAPH